MQQGSCLVRQYRQPGQERQGALHRSALTSPGHCGYHHGPPLLVVVPLSRMGRLPPIGANLTISPFLPKGCRMLLVQLHVA